MKIIKQRTNRKSCLETELLILPDGRIFVQSLTQPMAEILRKLNPRDRQIAPRADVAQTSKSAVPRVSKPACLDNFSAPQIWKSATQQVWKPAPRRKK